MATSIGQDAPVLPGEPPSLTGKPGRPQSTGSQRVGHYQSEPAWIDARLFFTCGSSAPVRVEHEGGAAAWLEGTLAVPSVQRHRLLPRQELWPCQSLFLEPLVAGDQKASSASLSPWFCLFRHLEDSLAWGPSLLLGASGT